MTAQVTGTSAPLSADFIPQIPNTAVSVFVGRIRHVEASSTMVDSLSTQVGSLVIEVTESISHTGPPVGSSIILGFHQITDIMVRLRNGRDHWNQLNLSEGQLLLFACKPDANHGWQAVAAKGVSTADDTAVVAMRQSYVIERDHADGKHLLLMKALEGQNLDLLAYALNALGVRNELGRQTGVRVMTDAMQETGTPLANRKEIGAVLTRTFSTISDNSKLQTLTLQTLALALVKERDKEEQATWASRLVGCLFDRSVSAQHRRTMIHDIHAPTNAEVVQKLTMLEHDTSIVPNLEDRRMIAELAAVWRSAE